MYSSVLALADFDTCARQVSSICRPWQLVSQQRRSFRGSIRNFTAAALNITELALDRSRMQAQPDTLASGSSRYYSLLMQIRGSGRVHGEHGEEPLHAGDLILMDSASTTAVESSDATLQYSLNFFRPEDVLRLDAARSLAGRPFACSAGPAAVLRDSLESTVRNADTLGSLDLRAHAIDLLLAAFGVIPGAALPGGSGERVSVESLTRYIDANLEDAALCPQRLARVFRVSLRALYRITAGEGLTPAALIWKRRLSTARQRLHGDAASITAIAHQSGFKDSGHFSRAFRREFGETPSRVRKGLRAPGTIRRS